MVVQWVGAGLYKEHHSERLQSAGSERAVRSVVSRVCVPIMVWRLQSVVKIIEYLQDRVNSK